MARTNGKPAHRGGFRRLLRLLLIVFGIFVFVLFSATFTLVFNPLEGAFGDVTMAVPRGVDFCLRKERLAEEFAAFPIPAGWEALEGTEAWSGLETGPTVRDLDAALGFGKDAKSGRPLGLGASLEQVQRELAGQPIDIFRNLAGRDLALAGNLRGRDLGQAAWCLYTRVGWKVRAAMGLARYSFTHRWMPAGMTLTLADQVFELGGLPEGRRLWFGRHRDLLVAGNDRDLVVRSLGVAAGDSKDEALGSSADYEDGVRKAMEIDIDPGGEPEGLPGLDEAAQAALAQRASALERGRSLEFFLSPANLFKARPEWGEWPSAKAPDLASRLASLFLQPRSFRRSGGAVNFDRDPRGLSLAATLDVNPQEGTPFFQKWLGVKPEPNERFLNSLARVTPVRAAAMAALRLPVQSFMRELYDLLDPSERELILDSLRNTGRYQAVDQFIEDFFGGCLPRLGVVVRANDFTPLPDDPKTDGLPVPAVGLVLWTRSGEGERLKRLVEFLQRYRSQWGFTAVYTLSAGPARQYDVYEFHSPQISGTGCMAVLVKREFGRGESELILANSGRLAREMIDARFREGGVTPLETEDDWRTLRAELPASTSGLVYVNGARLVEILQKWEPHWVAAAGGDQAAFFESFRPSAERALLRERYPGRSSPEELPQALQAEFDKELRRRLDQEWQTRAGRSSKDAAPRIQDRIKALRLLDHLYLHLYCGPRQLKVRGRMTLHLW